MHSKRRPNFCHCNFSVTLSLLFCGNRGLHTLPEPIIGTCKIFCEQQLVLEKLCLNQNMPIWADLFHGQGKKNGACSIPDRSD